MRELAAEPEDGKGPGFWCNIRLSRGPHGDSQCRFVRVKTLKAAGARVAVVYHDAEPYSGTRVIDRLRRRAQLRTMRKALLVS